MDKSWIKLPNVHPTYIKGCEKFIDLAKENLVEGKIRCPCKKCRVDKWLPIDEVMGHLLFKGFYKEYKNWIFHGKGDILERAIGADKGSTSHASLISPTCIVDRDDMGGLLKAAFASIPLKEAVEPYAGAPDLDDIADENSASQSSTTVSSEEEIKYKKLLDALNEELYPGCNTFPKLSFLLHLFHLK